MLLVPSKADADSTAAAAAMAPRRARVLRLFGLMVSPIEVDQWVIRGQQMRPLIVLLPNPRGLR
jgi:hypothetical protein